MDDKWKYIIELIAKEKASVLCVQETKLVSLYASPCFSLWGSNDISWVHRGIACEGWGILTLCDNKVFKCDLSVKGKGFVLVVEDYKCGVSGPNVNVLIMNIYAPCSNKEKVLLWRKLEDKLANSNYLIRYMIGDFNSVTNVSERKEINKGTMNNYEIARFSEFIDRCTLKDIPLVGRKFTWYKPNGTTRNRLDRALVSDEWLMQWSGSKQYMLSRQVCGHCALVV